MNKPLCIVLIPFDSSGEERFTMLKEIGEELGFETLRVAQYYSSGMILEEIVRSIRDAHLVIADLTSSNPNVYYEVGIAHALGKRVFLTAEDRESIPVDLGNVQICKLEVTRTGRDQLLRELKKFHDTPGTLSPIGLFTGGTAVAGQRLTARRFGSFLSDLLISGIPLGILLAAATLMFKSPEWLPGSLFFAGFIAYLFLTTLLLGASPGQRILGLKVIRLDRTRPSTWQSLFRPIASLLNLVSFGVGFLWAAKAPRYQAVHDIITRTLVVKQRLPEPGDIQAAH